jgi:hypothetical protein
MMATAPALSTSSVTGATSAVLMKLPAALSSPNTSSTGRPRINSMITPRTTAGMAPHRNVATR